MIEMPDPRPGGSPPVRWWEELETWKQVVIGGPFMVVLLFVLNTGPMAQPPGRSAGYALLEGAFFTALLIVATHHERDKRRRRASPGQASPEAGPGDDDERSG